MSTYTLSHVSDPDLLRGLTASVAQDRATTALVLAHLAEFDARRLYVAAAYPSMYAYCVHELRLSEDAAYKRIQAARLARRFPVLFEAVADGRLHLSAVGLLAPHLTPENADELLVAVTHRTKSEIEELVAARFQRAESIELDGAPPAATLLGDVRLAPGQVVSPESGPPKTTPFQLAPGQVERGPKSASDAPEHFPLQVTIAPGTRDKLRYARELLGHELRSGDPARVIDRALDALIQQLERRQRAATTRPSRSPRPSADPRHVPAHVKRTVWARDGGRCTFVSESGRRCPARRHLEFDHLEPVARGGEATVAEIRLRCRAHNQFEAERTFGAGFMHEKRGAARCAAEARRRESAARAAAAEASPARDVVPWLRQLGFRADEARRAAVQCESIPDASLEERVRFALSVLSPPHRRLTNHLGTAI